MFKGSRYFHKLISNRTFYAIKKNLELLTIEKKLRVDKEGMG